jgi:hypothetical protein
LFFTALLIVAPILDDIDDAVDLEMFTDQRCLRVKDFNHRHVVEALNWVSCSFRKWVLPMMVVGASLGLILRSPLTSQNLLLNGVAITFVTTLDDTIGWVIFSDQRGVDPRPKLQIPLVIWKFHRVHALCLIISLLFTVMFAPELMHTFGNERKYGSACSDLREIVVVICFYVCVAGAVLNAFFRLSLWWTDPQTIENEQRYKRAFLRRYSGWSQWCGAGGGTLYAVSIAARFLANLCIPALMVLVTRNEVINQGWLFWIQVSDPWWPRELPD